MPAARHTRRSLYSKDARDEALAQLSTIRKWFVAFSRFNNTVEKFAVLDVYTIGKNNAKHK